MTIQKDRVVAEQNHCTLLGRVDSPCSMVLKEPSH